MWRVVILGAFAVGVAACLPKDKRSNEAQHNLDQERECGKQAARVFNEQWKEFAAGYNRWESHYNSKLNRCLLKALNPGDPWTVVVVDADTRHVLARYSGNWSPKLEAFDFKPEATALRSVKSARAMALSARLMRPLRNW